MKSLYLILFVLTVYNVSAQDNRLLRDYYMFANKAELSIINKKTAQALEYYSKAFNTGYGFPVDKYNAFVASYFLKDTVKSQIYFNDLVKVGQDKAKLIKYFLGPTDIQDVAYLDYISRDYDSIHSQVMKSRLPELAKKMDDIFAFDQQCRKQSTDDESLRNCDKQVRDSLYKFIETYGFPNAKRGALMEYGVIQATNIDHFDMILYHSRGLPFQEKIFQLALEAVKNGDYDARRFSIAFGYPGSEYPVLIPYEPITRSQLEEINIKRAEIYLEPLEDYYRKVTFHTKNEEYYRGNYCFLDPFMCLFALNIPLNIIE